MRTLLFQEQLMARSNHFWIIEVWTLLRGAGGGDQERGDRRQQGPRHGSSLRQFERNQCRRRRHLFQLREQRWQQNRRVRSPATRYQNILLAIDSVADDAAAHAGSGVEAPELLACLGIQGPQ